MSLEAFHIETILLKAELYDETLKKRQTFVNQKIGDIRNVQQTSMRI